MAAHLYLNESNIVSIESETKREYDCPPITKRYGWFSSKSETYYTTDDTSWGNRYDSLKELYEKEYKEANDIGFDGESLFFKPVIIIKMADKSERRIYCDSDHELAVLLRCLQEKLAGDYIDIAMVKENTNYELYKEEKRSKQIEDALNERIKEEEGKNKDDKNAKD